MPDYHKSTQDYVNAVGEVGEQGQFSIEPREFSWMLGATSQWNILRLELLTALQRSLSRVSTEESDDLRSARLNADMKTLLSDVIIMQTRVNRREENLVHLLDQTIDNGALERVGVDPEMVSRWAESIAQTQRHIERVQTA